MNSHPDYAMMALIALFGRLNIFASMVLIVMEYVNKRSVRVPAIIAAAWFMLILAFVNLFFYAPAAQNNPRSVAANMSSEGKIP